MDTTELNKVIRIGTISSIDPKTATARVLFEERDNQVSFDLPIIFPRTKDTQDYFMPTVGEEVLCIFLPNGMEEGFVIGSYYNRYKPETIPENNEHKRLIKFKDGTLIEYDTEKSKLTIDTIGEINIKASNINIEGNVNVIGNINASGSIKDAGGNTANHSH